MSEDVSFVFAGKSVAFSYIRCYEVELSGCDDSCGVVCGYEDSLVNSSGSFLCSCYLHRAGLAGLFLLHRGLDPFGLLLGHACGCEFLDDLVLRLAGSHSVLDVCYDSIVTHLGFRRYRRQGEGKGHRNDNQ